MFDVPDTDKTKLIVTAAQPPSFLSTPLGFFEYRLGVPQWGVATGAKGSRHVAASGCRGLGEYLPTKPNALEWL